jgi:hypothetical protein
MVREAKSEEEKAFLLSELALELFRAKPCEGPGCLSPEEVRTRLRSVIALLRSQIPEASLGNVENLKFYLDDVFKLISG